MQGLSSERSFTPTLADSGVSKTGCKAYWKLDESSGTLVNYATTGNGFADGLGTSADSSSTQNLTYAQTGKLGNAISFNGTTSSSNAIIGTSLSQFNFMHNTSGLFTFNVWYKKTAIDTGFRTIIANHFGGAGQAGARVAFNGSLGVQIIIQDAGGNPIVSDTTSGFLPNDTNWNMLTVTYDYSLASNNMKVYSNGALHHSITKTGTATNNNPPFALRIGDDNGGDGNMYGLLDDMSIFNRVLTNDEISTLYSGISKLQDQSRFEETDTQTMYYLLGTTSETYATVSTIENDSQDSSQIAVGEKVTSTALRGRNISSALFKLTRVGGAGGTLVCRIRKISDQSIVATSTNSFTVSTMSTSPTEYTFNFSNAVIPNEEYAVLVEGATGTYPSSYVGVYGANTGSGGLTSLGNGTNLTGGIWSNYSFDAYCVVTTSPSWSAQQ